MNEIPPVIWVHAQILILIVPGFNYAEFLETAIRPFHSQMVKVSWNQITLWGYVRISLSTGKIRLQLGFGLNSYFLPGTEEGYMLDLLFNPFVLNIW